MYSGTNNGFLLKDATESDSSGVKQNYASRENTPNDPELVLTWG